jgi:hypothetical protein
MTFDYVILALVATGLIVSFVGAAFCYIRDSKWLRRRRERAARRRRFALHR